MGTCAKVQSTEKTLAPTDAATVSLMARSRRVVCWEGSVLDKPKQRG